MSNKLCTEKEIGVLSRNPYVKTVSSKGITYTNEFKRIFIAENEEGKFPREIFEEHGDIKYSWYETCCIIGQEMCCI